MLSQLASDQALTSARLAHLNGCKIKEVNAVLYHLLNKGLVDIAHRGGSSGQQPFWALKEGSLTEGPPASSHQMYPAQNTPPQLGRLACSDVASPVLIGIRSRDVLDLAQPPLVGAQQVQGWPSQSDVEQQHQADAGMETEFQEPTSRECMKGTAPLSDSISVIGETSTAPGLPVESHPPVMKIASPLLNAATPPEHPMTHDQRKSQSKWVVGNWIVYQLYISIRTRAGRY